jgi:hypothetical protein
MNDISKICEMVGNNAKGWQWKRYKIYQRTKTSAISAHGFIPARFQDFRLRTDQL